MPQPSPDLAVVVLAGGRSSRFGSDKLAADLDGAPLLDATLGLLPAEAAVIVVGPARPLARPASFVREEPALGGPAAALAAGLRAALAGGASRIATLPGDAPYAGEAVAELLAGLADDHRVVVGHDESGVDQPLQLALDRAGAAAWLAAAGDASGRSARRVLEALPAVRRVRLATRQVRDVDTVEDLRAVSRRARDATR